MDYEKPGTWFLCIRPGAATKYPKIEPDVFAEEYYISQYFLQPTSSARVAKDYFQYRRTSLTMEPFRVQVSHIVINNA